MPRKMNAASFETAIEKLGLSQRRSSKLFGVGERTVRRWIAENEIPIAVSVLLRVMIKTGVSVEEAEGL